MERAGISRDPVSLLALFFGVAIVVPSLIVMAISIVAAGRLALGF